MIIKIESKEKIIQIDKMIDSFFVESQLNKIIGIEVPSNIPIKKLLFFSDEEMEISNTFLFEALLKLIILKKQKGFYLFDPIGHLPLPKIEECYYFVPIHDSKNYPKYVDWFFGHIIISVSGDWCIYFRPDNIGILAMKFEDDYKFINIENKVDNLINIYLQEIKQSISRYAEQYQEKKFMNRLYDSGFFVMMDNIYGEDKAKDLLILNDII